MIRKLEQRDLDVVMQIWLKTNRKAHSFISSKYWTDHYDMVKSILPRTEVYVHEDGETKQVDGFIGLNGNYIEGIFVESMKQSNGIGSRLLDYAKKSKSDMSLHVYQKNVRAIAFYQREGFHIQSENIDENTNEKEYTMIWYK